MSRVGDVKVAKRYATALFQAADRLGSVDAVQSDLGELAELWSSVPRLRQAIESPLVPAEKKKEILRQALSSKIDPLSLTFLNLLVDKRREEILPSVRLEFLRQADDSRGLVRAEATVSAPMDDLQKAAMVESLERRTGKRVELAVHVDPSVLGGAVVRMGDTVIDGSVRGALERIREQMLER